MKRKITTLFIFMIMCVSLIMGCGFTPLQVGPNLNDEVKGNGGLAVQKGDYLYFVNGYVSSGDLVAGDNAYGNVDNSAIYRAELDNEGNLVYDENGILQNAEVLIPKVVGYEYGGFFIFDNYIYFATPNTEKNSSGEVMFKLTEFYRADLNGANVSRIYVSQNSSTNFKFAFYKTLDTVVLMVYDGTDLIRIDANQKTMNIVSTNVTSVQFEQISSYNRDVHGEEYSEVFAYYTRTANEDEETITNGNILARVSVEDGQEEVLKRDNVNTYDVKHLTDGKLFYTRKSSTELNAYYYVVDLETNINFENAKKLTLTAYKDVKFALDIDGNVQGLVVNNGTVVSFIDANDITNIKTIYDAESLTILFVSNNYVYGYNAENKLIRFDIDGQTIQTLSNEEDTLNFKMKNNVDFDDSFIYFYRTFKNDEHTSNYLSRIRINGGEFETEFCGVMEEKHLIEEEK